MNRNQIRAKLVERGITLAEIARELNVTISGVSKVLASASVSARIRQRVAERLDTTVKHLWP